ncbi:MAG: MFS transporter [Anaerolineales bacterium]|jgi:FHS family Na+ dependent glucose MFS transporter 1
MGLTLSEVGKEKTYKTIAYYASFVVLGVTTAILGPTLPGLASHTGTQLREISFLFTARSLGYLLGSLLGGWAYDRFTGHIVLAGSLLILSGTALLTPLIPVLWVLAAVLLLMGIGEGGTDVGGNTLLVRVYRDKVGPYMNGLHFFFGLGAFLSPIVVAWAVQMSGDINWGYWFLALLVLPVVVWLLRLPSPQAPEEQGYGSQVNHDYLLIAMVVLFLFLYVGAEASYGGWVFTYSTRKLDLSETSNAAYLTSAFWGALTVGRLVSIPLALRIRPRVMLLVDLIGCLVSLGLVLLWPSSVTVIWIGSLGLGLFMAAIFPTTLTLAGRHMKMTGQVTGWFFVGAGLGGMFLPWLIGQLFEEIGPRVTMYVIAIDLVIAFGVYLLLVSLITSRGGREKI